MVRAWVEPLLAIGLALGLAGGLLLSLGADPRAALEALAGGAFGSAYALESTLTRAVPLCLVGLAIALAFRAGVWNIGGEGQICAGALAATALGTRALFGAPLAVHLSLVLLAGAIAGALWAGIAAWLRVHRGVSEVLSTILLNFIALLGVAFAVHGPLQEAAGAYPQSDALLAGARLPRFPGLERLHAAAPLALLLPGLAWLMLFRSAAGLRLRAVGLAPEAARYAGLSPPREIVRVLLLSGGIAGLAGAIEIAGVTARLFEGLSAGIGFTAIAVALLGRLHPLAVIPAAVFFAALATGSGSLQRAAHVPKVLVQVIEALVIFLSVGFALRRGGR